MRAAFIEAHFVPAVQKAFARYPALQSATMLVAQYWCDEALDAVHCELLFSQLATPDITAANTARREAYEAEDGPQPQRSGESPWHRWLPWLRPRPAKRDLAPVRQQFAQVNLPAGLVQDELDRAYVWDIPWDSNDEAIALFAAFCLENCHQEMEPGEAYSPYAIFRRRGARIDIEVVGLMRRPWLDGVEPGGTEDDA